MAEQGGNNVLVVGATGYIGRYMATASVAAGFSTSALVRPNSNKLSSIGSLQSAGVRILYGSLEDHDSLIAALRNIDIVISAVGIPQILDQLKLIQAIQEVKTVKRFIPSEFGSEMDKVVWLKPCQDVLIEPKIRIRRATEAAGIPYTYIVTNGFARFHFNIREENGKLMPPSGKFIVYGDGNTKASFTVEEDIATYTLKAANDIRTLNKTLHIRPPSNALSQNETVAIIEEITKQVIQKEYISGDELLKQLQEESGSFKGVILGLMHSAYIKGDTFSFPLGPNDVVAHELYPDVKHTDPRAYLIRYVCGRDTQIIIQCSEESKNPGFFY